MKMPLQFSLLMEKGVKTPQVNNTALNLGGQGVAGGVLWQNKAQLSYRNLCQRGFLFSHMHIHTCVHLSPADTEGLLQHTIHSCATDPSADSVLGTLV